MTSHLTPLSDGRLAVIPEGMMPDNQSFVERDWKAQAIASAIPIVDSEQEKALYELAVSKGQHHNKNWRPAVGEIYPLDLDGIWENVEYCNCELNAMRGTAVLCLMCSGKNKFVRFIPKEGKEEVHPALKFEFDPNAEITFEEWERMSKHTAPEDTKTNQAWRGAWLQGEMTGYAKCMVERVFKSEEPKKEVAELK